VNKESPPVARPGKKVGGLGGRNLFIGRHFHPTGSAERPVRNSQ
jgi:hypothetical protein